MRNRIVFALVLLLAGGVASAALNPYSYTFELENTETGVSNARLRFAFNGLPVPGEEYFIDNVTLSCDGGPNLLVNGDFGTLAQAPWKFYSNAPLPKPTLAFVTGEAVITFRLPSSNQQLYQHGITLPAAGVDCTVTFDACSTGGPGDPGYGHNVSLYLIKHQAPNTNYGLSLSGAPSVLDIDLLSCSAVVGPVCGDGTLDDGEDCDDGGESEFCNSDCTAASCGDGIVNSTAGEECDAGTMKEAPSCTSVCLIPDGDCASSVCSLFWLTGATPVPEFCLPRFVDNNNGTITDTVTGLVWLKDADCLGSANFDAANAKAAALGEGTTDGTACGLTDGSSPGDWHLPSLECPANAGFSCSVADSTGEFSTIFAFPSVCGSAPFIPDAAGTSCWSEGDAFSGVLSGLYWSSTTNAGNPGGAWGAVLNGGDVATVGKTNNSRVWPVRVGP